MYIYTYICGYPVWCLISFAWSHLQFWWHDGPIFPGPGRESPLCQTQLLQSQQWRGGEYYTSTHGGLFGLGLCKISSGIIGNPGFTYIHLYMCMYIHIPGGHELPSVQVVLCYWIGVRGAIQSYASTAGIALHPALRNSAMRLYIYIVKPVHTLYMYMQHDTYM